MTPTGTSDSVIVSSIEDHVGTIVLNRPGVLNAFNLALARQFLATLDEFDRDDDVRAVVIRGAGRVFSAGGDIREMLSCLRSGEDRAAYFRVPLSAFGEIVLALRRTPKPVLAAVHGAVAGVAFNAMLACDLTIAAEKTRFTQAFIKLGLSPDGGGTWFLPRIVGYARACELTFLPTELDAATARDWGLINWVVPEEEFDTTVKETALQLASAPVAGMARTKALLNSAYERDLASQIEAERLAQVDNAASHDFEEGITAFVEKREPRFGR